MFLRSFIAIGVFFFFGIHGQDLYFTQMDAQRMYFNPAATGMTDGHFRAVALHRQQWGAMQKGFVSSYASFEVPFYDRIDKINKAGLGGFFFQDVAGLSRFKTTQACLAASGIVEIGPSHFLSGGIGASLIQRNYDLSTIQWVNQYDGKKYNSALPHYENVYLPALYFLDVCIGARYEHHFVKKSFRKVSFKYFALDASLAHVTAPSMMYRLASEEVYARRISMGFQYLYDFNSSRMGMNWFCQYMRQGAFQWFQSGLLFRYRLSEQSQITGIRNYKVFSGGIIWRQTGNIVPNLRFRLSDVEIGLCYDIFMSAQPYGAKGFSAFEIQLIYERIRKNF